MSSRESTDALVLMNVKDREYFRILHFIYFVFSPFDQKNPYLSTILVNKELHLADSDRSCRHIEFKIDNTRVRYEAGDHLGIFPKNDSALVDKIGKLLDINLETVFKLINLDSEFFQLHNLKQILF